jgi:hypothetical protein
VPLAKLRKARMGDSVSASSAQQTVPHHSQHPIPTIPTIGRNYASESGGGGGGGYNGQSMRSGAVLPRYIPASEGRAWAGMIPVGNVGMGSSSGYPAYWGNGFQGIGAWEQGLQVPGQTPRKSV